MMYPPLLMNVRVKTGENRWGFFIPLPLFLVLPVALVILVVLSPLILAAAIVMWAKGYGNWVFRALGSASGVYCAMRGLNVDVRGPQTLVKVTVI